MAELSAVPAVPASDITLLQAFEQTAAERNAVVAPQHMTVDVTTAVTTALGAVGAITAQKGAIDATFKNFPMRLIDNLETYAYAALFAHTAWLFASSPPAQLQELVAEATRQRVRIIPVLETASVHGLIPSEVLKELQGSKGHKNLAVDLLGSVSVLRKYWSKLEGKVPVTQSDLAQIEQLGQTLVKALGVRDQAPDADGQISLDRKRAFTLLAQAYGELRSAIQYVRRAEGDADEIAPSLYAGRGGSRRKEDEQPDAPLAAAAPAPASKLPVGHPDSNPLAEA